MIELVSKNECSGCATCATVCPQKCITMVPDKMGFYYPKIESERCIQCGLCQTRCPINHKTVQEESGYIREAYAMVAKDEKIRAKSSSGGIFYLVARYVILHNGVVFGAAFNDTFHSVEHIIVDSLDGLKKLQGSKYLQSYIGTSYALAKEYLEQDRLVLFTGTPCQIAGLRAFLNKDYSNLYLQDIVCHGVPSPAVWDDYLTSLEKRYGAKVRRVSFRDKERGWENYLLRVEFDNGAVYSSTRTNDLYMRGFLHNCFLRPSCYACAHKGIERSADITLADFWGVKDICPQLQDGKGTSLVIVSSPKGKFLIEQIYSEMLVKKIVLGDAIKYNPAIVESSDDNPKREKFEKDFRQKRIVAVLKEYCSMSKFKKLKKAIKSFFKSKK